MSDPEEHISTWLENRVIDTQTAARLREFEASRAPAGTAPRAAAPDSADRPGIIEALLYLGFVIAGAGAFFLVAQQWDQLESWARVALVAVPAVLAMAAGAGMHFSGQPGIARAGHVAWLLALALFAGTLAVAFAEYGPENSGDERRLLLIIAVLTFAVALAQWAVAPSNPQVVGVTAAALFFGEALGAWPDDYNSRLAGLAIALAGIAMLALVETGRFRPRPISRLAGGALLGFGAFHTSFDSSIAWEMLSFVAGAALIALGVFRNSFTYVAIGVATLLVALITFMFEHFEDRIGAPVALMLSGGLLVAAVVILVQVRGVVRRRRSPS